MIIMSIVGSMLVIGSGYGIGEYYSNKIVKRIDELSELHKIMIYFQANIRYSNSTIPEIISQLGKREKSCYQDFFMEINKNINNKQGRNLYEIWKKSLENTKGKLNINEDDIEELTKFGEIVGQMDKQMQYDNINLYINILTEKISEIKKKYLEKKRMYRMLGIMGAILIVIILI